VSAGVWWRWAGCAGLWACAAAVHATTGGQPEFAQYPAHMAPATTGLAKALHFSTDQGRRYRTAIRQAAQQGPNFAGHHRLATWGCGTDCRGFAIVNLKTGQVYTHPHIQLVAGVMGNGDERLAFRADSRLLVISGALDDDPARTAQFFYLWQGRRLQLLMRRALLIDEPPTE
jgi:hypothetical protein